MEAAVSTPKFVHDCTACSFLGHVVLADTPTNGPDAFDVYRCPAISGHAQYDTLIARYSSEGARYASASIETAIQWLTHGSTIYATGEHTNALLPYERAMLIGLLNSLSQPLEVYTARYEDGVVTNVFRTKAKAEQFVNAQNEKSGVFGMDVETWTAE
jgi:hypothetical protein